MSSRIEIHAAMGNALKQQTGSKFIVYFATRGKRALDGEGENMAPQPERLTHVCHALDRTRERVKEKGTHLVMVIISKMCLQSYWSPTWLFVNQTYPRTRHVLLL